MASTIITTHTKVSDIPEDLEHSGVKGMRWGVRSDRATARDQGREKAIGNFSPKNVPNFARGNMVLAAKDHNMMLGDVVKINRSPKYKNADLRANDKLRKEYIKDVSKSLEKRLQNVANARLNDKGKYKVSAYIKDFGPLVVRMALLGFEHADDNKDDEFEIPLDWDDKGFIVGITDVNMEHSGVKGMRWGVRKDTAKGPAKGGYNPKAHPRKMTEDELKATVARLKLEKEYKSLTAKQKGEGSKFLNKMLVSSGTVLVGILVNHYLGDPLKDHLKTTKAAKTAITPANVGGMGLTKSAKKAKKAGKAIKYISDPKIKISDVGSFT